MFTSDKKLQIRGGCREERFSYLIKLAEEFRGSWLLDVKRQTAGNLANFAYDPYNYDFLRHVKAIEIFRDCLNSSDIQLIRIGSAGFCNLSSDETFASEIRAKFLTELLNLLDCDDEDTLISVISTLVFIGERSDQPKIIKLATDQRFSARLSNVAEVYLNPTA